MDIFGEKKYKFILFGLLVLISTLAFNFKSEIYDLSKTVSKEKKTKSSLQNVEIQYEFYQLLQIIRYT